MTPLALISDDFTGALDTGVQFAQYGLTVKIAALQEILTNGFNQDSVDVLVVNAETRHLPAHEAYDLTVRLIKKALQSSVSHIYIKTDSGLRGNIGSELKAALNVSGQNFIPFLPAFPDMNRITKDGIHYIDQTPIHESVFGIDPFEPVSSPYVKDLFKDVDIKVESMTASNPYRTDFQEPTIGIFDAETNEDFHNIARHLQKKDQLKIVAGCAGFAAILPEYIGFEKKARPLPILGKPLLTVCGSLNPITQRQIEYVQKKGFFRIVMEPQQVLESGYFSSGEGVQWLDSLKELFQKDCPIVVDTGISQQGVMQAYLDQHFIEKETARTRIASALGNLIKQFLARGYGQNRTLMIIGGDTLLGFIRQMDLQEISPICELEPGTVLSSTLIEGQNLWLISKSGGFGEDDLLEQIAHKVGAPSAEEKI